MSLKDDSTKSTLDPASILVINSDGVLGSLLISVSPSDLPPYIELVDVETFTQFENPESNGNGSAPDMIILDIPDPSTSERVKHRIKSSPRYMDAPMVDIHTTSGIETDHLLDLIQQITHRQRAFPSSITNPVDGKQMLLVPAGSYKRRYGISPFYSLKLAERKTEAVTNAYYMDMYPVTVKEYAAFITQTGYAPSSRWQEARQKGIPDDHPACGITWEDVIAYAQWSGKRIPTPNEWEKAAFGTNGMMFPWGDEFLPQLCNILESNIGSASPVGAYSPKGDSPFGFGDMIGNVWEWVYDWTASSDNRLLLGGAWDTPLEYLMPPFYARVRANPGLAGQNFGFRLVASPDVQSHIKPLSENRSSQVS